MIDSLEALNAASAADAAARLRDCCGSSRWVEAMVRQRPFRSVEHLLAAAETAWHRTGPADRDEAFAHHPRIGERRAEALVSPAARAWSAGEQAAASGPDRDLQALLAAATMEYERRFGRIYLVCATGLTAQDIVADLRRRLNNPPEAERDVAAAEQARITALRLRKLVGGHP